MKRIWMQEYCKITRLNVLIEKSKRILKYRIWNKCECVKVMKERKISHYFSNLYQPLQGRWWSKCLLRTVKLSRIRVCHWVRGMLSSISNAPFHASSHTRSQCYNGEKRRKKRKNNRRITKYPSGIN